ncbi:uncharacterized protein UV8b_04488 [Ustilaginoidea virens]|uniref:Uncharacterized protein n=1 Tax=Ustilaginoidea virens TaxID=1159556 RepID=A0A8E5HRN7_USTVR|nr:uncharacterized protein UV8b_04488 [Ustilaginoidea virens]QUC20247.1 hypothetical protein UV8b_04488 [Ustilaginoidea virens]
MFQCRLRVGVWLHVRTYATKQANKDFHNRAFHEYADHGTSYVADLTFESLLASWPNHTWSSHRPCHN